MLTSRIISNLSGLGEISFDWDKLACKNEFYDVFISSGFAKAWWRAFGENKNLLICVIGDENGNLRLVAPFFSYKSSPRDLFLIGDYRADYTNLICEKDDLEAVEFLFAWLKQQNFWNMIRMKKIPGSSTVIKFISSWKDSCWKCENGGSSFIMHGRISVELEWHEQHPTIQHGKIEQLAKYFSSPSHIKKFNRFRKLGSIEYQCITESEKIRKWLPHFLNLHIEQWERRGGSQFLVPNNVNFYYYLLDDLQAYSHSLRLDLLLLDSELIAAHFGFTWDRRIYYYKPCLQIKYAKYSPGKILLEQIIQSAAKKEISEVDLLFGMEEYKLRYTSNIRKTGSLIICRSLLN